MEIEIVPNEACPVCGCDGSNSEYPNRPKVHDGKVWWWRCYDPDCIVDYYEPISGRYDLKPTEEQKAERDRKAKEWVDSLDLSKIKVTTVHADGTVTEGMGI